MDTNSDATNAMKHYQQQASIIGNMEKFGLLRSQTYYIEFGAGRGIELGYTLVMSWMVETAAIKLIRCLNFDLIICG